MLEIIFIINVIIIIIIIVIQKNILYFLKIPMLNMSVNHITLCDTVRGCNDSWPNKGRSVAWGGGGRTLKLNNIYTV